MSVFDNYKREYFKGPVIGGNKDGTVIVHPASVYRVPKPRDLSHYLEAYPQGKKGLSQDTMEVETYRHSRHGFWYLDTLGENEARQRFVSGDDVEAWADDDA